MSELIVAGLVVLVPAAFLGVLIAGAWGFTVGFAEEDCCARCRYPTAGLAGLTCPECGADLRGRGTRRKGRRFILRPPFVVMAACRTVLLGLLLWPLANAADDAAPYIRSRSLATATSDTGLFTRATITGKGSRSAVRLSRENTLNVGVARAPTTAHLDGPAGRRSLRLLDLRGRAEFDGPSGTVRIDSGFGREHVLLWMRAAGIDTESDEAAQQARALETLIRNVAVGGGPIEEARPGGHLRGLTNVKMIVRRTRWAHPLALAGLSLAALLVWALLIRGAWRARPPGPSPS